MTTMKYKVTSMKEEYLYLVSFIEPLSISDDGVEELLLDFNNHSKNGATILSFREGAGAESQFQKK
jgi:hypothetical protein